jgi:uncharacterized protein with FMN-binding domain
LKSKRRWATSTSVIAIASIALGAGIDMYRNQDAGSSLIAKGPGTGSSSGTGNGTGSTTPADMKVTGDAVQYIYGTVQVEVVRTGGKISAVNMVQAGATNGREQAYPYLQQYAVSAQGSNFGNLSGATYTTEAFKQALDSAISKLSK